MCDGILTAHWSVECARCDFAGSDSAAAAADYDYVPDFLLLAVMVRFTPAVQLQSGKRWRNLSAVRKKNTYLKISFLIARSRRRPIGECLCPVTRALRRTDNTKT